MKTVQRTFIPGSRWVYFKLYAGTKKVDNILACDIPFIVKSLCKNGWIDKWFFIRYADPDFHLRVRILVTDEKYVGEVIRLFYGRLDTLVKSGLIWKIQLDTYNRELERYGESLIEEAETIFYIDSACMVSLLKKIKGKEENCRWMIALYLIDTFLSDFSMNITEKEQLTRHLSQSFKAEFGFDMYNSKQFNVKYREHKLTIEKVLKNRIESDDFNAFRIPIDKRSEELRTVISQVQYKLGKQKFIDVSLESLLSSYIHMTLNRLFRSKNRQHEMVLYDFMNRYYKSEIAKLKYAHS